MTDEEVGQDLRLGDRVLCVHESPKAPLFGYGNVAALHGVDLGSGISVVFDEVVTGGNSLDQRVTQGRGACIPARWILNVSGAHRSKGMALPSAKRTSGGGGGGGGGGGASAASKSAMMKAAMAAMPAMPLAAPVVAAAAPPPTVAKVDPGQALLAMFKTAQPVKPATPKSTTATTSGPSAESANLMAMLGVTTGSSSSSSAASASSALPPSSASAAVAAAAAALPATSSTKASVSVLTPGAVLIKQGRNNGKAAVAQTKKFSAGWETATLRAPNGPSGRGKGFGAARNMSSSPASADAANVDAAAAVVDEDLDEYADMWKTLLAESMAGGDANVGAKKGGKKKKK